MFIKYDNEGNILTMSGEKLETDDNYCEITDNMVDKDIAGIPKHLLYFDIVNKIIKKKDDVRVLTEYKIKHRDKIANELLNKYPIKQIDGTLNQILQEKLTEIDNCKDIESLKLIKA